MKANRRFPILGRRRENCWGRLKAAGRRRVAMQLETPKRSRGPPTQQGPQKVFSVHYPVSRPTIGAQAILTLQKTIPLPRSGASEATLNSEELALYSI